LAWRQGQLVAVLDTTGDPVGLAAGVLARVVAVPIKGPVAAARRISRGLPVLESHMLDFTLPCLYSAFSSYLDDCF